MLRQTIAVTLSAALLSGCATAGGARMTMSQQPQSTTPRSAEDQAVLAEYVQKLQPGTRVRVDRANGKAVKGTLMKASAASVVIQPRTRVPEPPIEVPLTDVVAVTPESTNGVAKTIGIGAAAGAAAALGTILILIAVFSD